MSKNYTRLLPILAWLAAIVVALSSTASNAQNKTRFCMTATDEYWANIPHATIKFLPLENSISKKRYRFKTDKKWATDVEIIDGIYDIQIHAENYQTVTIHRQLIPFNPRTCVQIKLPRHEQTD